MGRRRRWPARARRAAGGPSRDTGVCADEPACTARFHCEDGQGTRGRPANYAQRQAAGERESRPAHQPIVQILLGELPQRAQQGEQQEAFLAIHPQTSAGPGRQPRGTAPVGELDRQPTQGEQVQTADEREDITVQSHMTAPLRGTMPGEGRELERTDQPATCGADLRAEGASLGLRQDTPSLG